MELTKEFNDFQYLGSILCKYESMEGGTSLIAFKGRKLIESVGHTMTGGTVSIELRKALQGSILVLILV